MKITDKGIEFTIRGRIPTPHAKEAWRLREKTVLNERDRLRHRNSKAARKELRAQLDGD